MQEVFQQIRERHRQNPNHIHGRGRPLANPNPKPVHPLDLRSCVPPENLKASSLQQGSNNGKSCAKRECLCDLTSAIARKVPTKPHLEPNEKERSFTLLADLREQEEGEGLAGDNNDEDCSARRSSHRWNSDSLSFARHCEAKLEDLLNLDGSALNTFNESPDAQRTDACFHVLEELCESKLPFSCVLQHICDELRGALYQKSQDRTRKASSEQVRAYFELAHELEGEVAQMEAENSSWRSSVLAQDHDLLDTKGELQELADELSKANCASNELEEKLSATEQALSSEKEKVNGLREKIKKLKKEMKDIRHEVRCAQQIDAMKASEVEEYEKLKALYMQLVHEFQHAQAFLHASQCEVAESASKADLIAAKAEILDLGDKIYQVQAQIDAFAAETRLLTPRPQWGGQVPGMDKPLGLSTAQQIERICRENAFLAASTSRLQIDFAATGVTLAEIQEHGTNTARSEKKEKPEGNSTAMKSKGRGRVKEKTQKRES